MTVEIEKDRFHGHIGDDWWLVPKFLPAWVRCSQLCQSENFVSEFARCPVSAARLQRSLKSDTDA